MAYKIKAIRYTLEKARRCQVLEIDRAAGLYDVTSGNSGNTYRVDLHAVRCECPRQEWIGEENGHVNHCAHVQAAFIYRALKANYWLVGRSEKADLSKLNRKVVVLQKRNQLHGDGVKWTARKINEAEAKAKIQRFENGPTILPDNEIRKIARKSSKLVVGQEAPELEAA
jgi:hypothetical protein